MAGWRKGRRTWSRRFHQNPSCVLHHHPGQSQRRSGKDLRQVLFQVRREVKGQRRVLLIKCECRLSD